MARFSPLFHDLPLRAATSVLFTPDGGSLVSAESGGIVRLWNAASGREEGRWRTGVELSSIGFLGDSIWALDTDGRVDFLSFDLRPRAHLITKGDEAIVVTAEGCWCSGQGRLVENVKLFRGRESLNVAKAARFSTDEVRAVVTGKRPWLRSAWAATVRYVNWVVAWYRDLPAWGKAAVWPTAFYAAIALAVASIWLVRPHVLAHWAMPRSFGTEMLTDAAAKSTPLEMAAKIVIL